VAWKLESIAKKAFLNAQNAHIHTPSVVVALRERLFLLPKNGLNAITIIIILTSIFGV
jgi:hypothetical protein